MTIADLYTRYQTSLRNTAQRLTNNRDEADDLTQETFLRAMGHLTLLDRLTDGERQAWLFRTLKNLYIDRQRARQREEVFQKTFQQQIESETPSDPLMDRLRMESHPVVLMNLPELLDRVPEKDRDLLRRKYMIGMTSEEIGRALGIPAATIRCRIHLIIKKLRRVASRLPKSSPF